MMITSIEYLINYLSSLDWGYIITFILISHLVNQTKITAWFYKVTNVKIRTRYRVLLIGFCYGVMVYLLRGYTLSNIESLFESFVFAMVFHKLVVERLFAVLKLNPVDTQYDDYSEE
ncbi:hypothetical protein [uncultured Dokdonia sp.]|uniref:hypothetical protein n=1 Tax=uncultured Dokdonia sp. TaxID=575653 RepID=UPI0026268988|nr:hypothetical protein [uncultured Dokdonia sp.]